MLGPGSAGSDLSQPEHAASISHFVAQSLPIPGTSNGGYNRLAAAGRGDRSLPLADKRLGLPINFNAALIKDGISRIVNGLEEESHAKSQGRQEH